MMGYKRNSMLKILSTLLPLVVSVLMAAGCGHSSTSTNGIIDPVPDVDYLRATFNGRTWTSTDINAFRKTMFNSINISAFLRNGRSNEGIAFSMTGINSTGTYKIDPARCAAQMSVNDTAYATALAAGREYGTLKITALTADRITGTFDLIVYPNADISRTPMAVSNGSFNVKLTE